MKKKNSELYERQKRKYKSLKKSLKIKNKEILQKTGNKFASKRDEWIKEIDKKEKRNVYTSGHWWLYSIYKGWPNRAREPSLFCYLT